MRTAPVLLKPDTKQAFPSVAVTTTARLHFGFLDPSGRSAQPFGSFGLAIDRPGTRLLLQRGDTSEASGPEADRAGRYLDAIADNCGVRHTYRLQVAEAIPPHAGLGSGTQLALAVGLAFAAAEGLDLTPPEIAARLGRGARSGIGIATFEAGGAVLDSGPIGGALPRLVARVPFPEDWRVLLILDPNVRGLEGAHETAAFEALPDFPESDAAALREGVMTGAMPALEQRNFARFCTEVGRLQEVMGDYFGPLQGGPYTSPRVADILNWLRSEGVTGLGQSSWGPTGFAFAESESAGKALLQAAQNRWPDGALRFDLAQGHNAGADISVG